MFRPVDPSLDLVALEESMLARWREEDVFGESAAAKLRATLLRIARDERLATLTD